MDLLNQIIESLKSSGADEQSIQDALVELKQALDEKLGGGEAKEELPTDPQEIEAKKAEVFGK